MSTALELQTTRAFRARLPLFLIGAFLALLVLSCSTKTNDGGILKPPPPPPPKLSSARIAFTSTRGGTADLYLLNPQDSSVVRLTNDAPVEEVPVISPDSTAIAYMEKVSNR